MNDNQMYWIWLTSLYRMNTAKIKNIIHRFRTPKRVYDATPEELCEVKGITSQDVKSLNNKSLDRAKDIIEQMEKMDVRILTIDDPEYPKRLKDIDLPPYVLYIRGTLDWSDMRTMTVIGTRKNTNYGSYTTKVLCSALAENGFTIVSGMASGIDGIASEAALDAGGQTIAVLGSGIDVIYPEENEELYNRIIKNGAVITEYAPGTRPFPNNFPHRNRIMSGLGDGVLVIEAPKRSGALITANRAIDMGKNVFAVPGPIFKSAYEGTNRLIQQGAKPALSARDIICEYIYDEQILSRIKNVKADKAPLRECEYMDIEESLNMEDERFSELNDDEKKIISLLIDRNYGTDEMARVLDMKMNVLNNMLVNLELDGFVSKLAGNNYKINI